MKQDNNPSREVGLPILPIKWDSIRTRKKAKKKKELGTKRPPLQHMAHFEDGEKDSEHGWRKRTPLTLMSHVILGKVTEAIKRDSCPSQVTGSRLLPWVCNVVTQQISWGMCCLALNDMEVGHTKR